MFNGNSEIQLTADPPQETKKENETMKLLKSSHTGSSSYTEERESLLCPRPVNDRIYYSYKCLQNNLVPRAFSSENMGGITGWRPLKTRGLPPVLLLITLICLFNGVFRRVL